MRITVDLDDDLLLAVEQRRTACRTTGQVLVDLARQGLRTSSEPAPVVDLLREDSDRMPTLTRA